MVFTTFYFSGTGNTKWAVNTLHQTLREKGQQSRLFSIEDCPEDLSALIRDSDMIGFAFPVYGMNVPEIMKQFLQRTGKLFPRERKPVFVVTTFGYADGCGPHEALRHLVAKSAVLKGYVGLKIASNAATTEGKQPPLSPDEMRDRLIKCRGKIGGLADALGAGKKKIEAGVYSIVLLRNKMNGFVLDAYKHLSVDMTTCAQCFACVENCPTHSIEMIDGTLVIQSTCTACMRCYNNCPTCSILYDGNYVDPAVCPRYKGPASRTYSIDAEEYD